MSYFDNNPSFDKQRFAIQLRNIDKKKKTKPKLSEEQQIEKLKSLKKTTDSLALSVLFPPKT